MKYCPVCNYSFSDNQNFCTECGGPLSMYENTAIIAPAASATNKKHCAQCGDRRGSEYLFCSYCGFDLIN